MLGDMDIGWQRGSHFRQSFAPQELLVKNDRGETVVGDAVFPYNCTEYDSKQAIS